MGSVTIIKKVIIILLGLLIIITICLMSFDENIIKIGYIGNLSGLSSTKSQYSLKGIELAIEEINASGGIKGKKLQIIKKDVKNDPDKISEAIKYLKEQNVSVIIGLETSYLATTATPYLNKHKILGISSTAITEHLTGIDDYFIRTNTPLKKGNATYVAYLFEKKDLKNFDIIVDISNKEFSDNFYSEFKSNIEALGGRINQIVSFESQVDSNYNDILAPIINNHVNNLLLVTNAVDAGIITQLALRDNTYQQIVLSSWGATNEFIEYAGLASEGIIAYRGFNMDSQSRELLTFKQKFRDKYNIPPNHVSATSYEAMYFIAEGLKRIREINSNSLKQALLEIRKVKGLNYDYLIDEYGDADSSIYIIQVQNQVFKGISEND